MEVYNFQGSEGEQIPGTVEKLIVNEGVEELPGDLCHGYGHLREVSLPNGLIKIGNRAFRTCRNLLEIIICNTVRFIGRGAFSHCKLLAKVEFECSASSPHQLQTIDGHAFFLCQSLQRIRVPPSVTTVGECAFCGCSVLIEANLSTTCVTEISTEAFGECSSLQTVSLPSTLERICLSAFYDCQELAAVILPLDSQSIRIGDMCFYDCRKLANLLLPKGSTAEENSFEGCTLLYERYGKHASRVVDALVGRFENFPIHRMCYDHSGITVQELRQFTADQQEKGSLVDEFGMTPFHVLFSTIEPSMELLEVLLDSLPNQILKWKDANGKRPLEYLINNWTDGTSSLVQRTLQKWMIDQLDRWGTNSWLESMQSKVQSILSEENKEQRTGLYNEAHAAMERYENLEVTSILEMALWNKKLKSERSNDGAKRQALDREECRFLSGSDVAIPAIATFLGIQQRTPF